MGYQVCYDTSTSFHILRYPRNQNTKSYLERGTFNELYSQNNNFDYTFEPNKRTFITDNMQILAYPQASGSSDLARTDSIRSTQTTSSSRRPSTKPVSQQLSSTKKTKTRDDESKISASSILDSLNRKLDRFFDDIRENGYILRGSKYLHEAEDTRSLPPTPISGKDLELTYLIPKPLSSTKVPSRGESKRRKLSKPADAWKRIGSSEYRFI
ncbi:hypothetical protein PRZ48_005629 [Zasmidium cellare]|uniref:Uncharacterized protein n=1 Tax=Zasmidium cellare TaxID=395010 RepID=A0ABR0EKU8_ZASCE|nr:hypothetical protein PRZ48_005629 [Zasmidium cellare]